MKFKELATAGVFLLALLWGVAWTTHDAEKSYRKVRETVETQEYKDWIKERNDEYAGMVGIRKEDAQKFEGRAEESH